MSNKAPWMDVPLTGEEQLAPGECVGRYEIIDRIAARGTAVLFISSEIEELTGMCDRIVVMHAGHAVECAPTRALFTAPRHPYTARLMSSTPGERSTIASLQPVPGNLPDLKRDDLPACRFAERCERASVAWAHQQ